MSNKLKLMLRHIFTIDGLLGAVVLAALFGLVLAL